MKTLLNKLLIALIKGYQYLISPLLPGSCRFYPTCSAYAVEAIQIHGPYQGFIMAIKRIAKCHPYHPGGIDLVPEKDSDIECKHSSMNP